MERNNNLSYVEIIKKALNITWKNRYLWWLGFFIALPGFGMRISNLSSDEKMRPEDWEKYWNFLSSNLNWIIPLAILIFLILVVLCVLGIFAKIGVIKATEKIEKNEEFGFKPAMKEGKSYFWKFVLLSGLLALILIAVLLVMLIPVGILLLSESYIIGIILACVAILIFIPLAILFTFLKIFGQFYLVLGDLKIKESIENAYRLFLGNVKSSLLMGLFFILTFILFGAATLTAIIALAIPLAILGIILFITLKITGLIIAIILGAIPLLVLFVLLSSFFQAFSQVVWVLFFKEIASPKATEILEKIAAETESIKDTSTIPAPTIIETKKVD